MKTTLLAAFWISLAASGAARAELIFSVDLNTTPLTTAPGSAAGPFSLAFQFTQGDPANTTNTATVSDFNFGGGSPAACPSNCTVFGNESGDATGAINLNTSDGFEGLIQTFTPGNSLSFVVDLTTNPNSGAAPDTFGFSILDSAGFPIPTEDPSLADSLLTVFVDSANPTIDTYATDPNTLTNAGNVSITMAAATIGAPPTHVPEPGGLILLGGVLIALMGSAWWGRKWAGKADS